MLVSKRDRLLLKIHLNGYVHIVDGDNQISRVGENLTVMWNLQEIQTIANNNNYMLIGLSIDFISCFLRNYDTSRFFLIKNILQTNKTLRNWNTFIEINNFFGTIYFNYWKPLFYKFYNSNINQTNSDLNVTALFVFIQQTIKHFI